MPVCYNDVDNKVYKGAEHPPSQGERVYLVVPFTDKGEVKRLGARWGLGQSVNERTMSIGDVSYTQQQARDLLEWSTRFKSWWYWSNAVVRDDLPEKERLRFIQDTHSQSAFQKWEVDTDIMMRIWAEDTSSEFEYVNPNPGLHDHKVKTGQGWQLGVTTVGI
jgi:hypothetical protein